MFQCAISFFPKSSYDPELIFLWIVMIGSWSWSQREWLRSNSFHTLVWILLSTLNRNKYFQCTCRHMHTHIHNQCLCFFVYIHKHMYTHTHTHLYSDYTTMHISIGMDVATLYRWIGFNKHIYICWFMNIYITYSYMNLCIHSFIQQITKCLLWVRLYSRGLEYICEHTRQISLPLLEITFQTRGDNVTEQT